MKFFLIKFTLLYGLFCQSYLIPKSAPFNKELESLNVQAILKDSYGFLWIGTENGLYKYDGLNIHRIPSNEEDKFSLRSSHILSLFEARDKTLWIGTDQALTKLDRKNGIFKHYVNIPNDTSGLIDHYIHSIAEDSSGYLWIATDGSLAKMDPIKETFDNFTNKNSDLTFYHIKHTMVDQNNNLWASTTLKINKYLGGKAFKNFRATRLVENKRLLGSAEYNGNRTNMAYESSDGKIWIATDNGVSILDPKTERFIHHDYKLNHRFPNSGTIVNKIIEISKNKFLLGTNDGLFVVDFDKNNHAKFDRILRGTSYDFHKDENNVLWIASNRGVFYMSLETIPIRMFNDLKSVTTIKEFNNNLWIGHYKGVSKYDFKTQTSNFIFRFEKIKKIEFQNDDAVWYAGLRGDLFRTYLKQDKIERYYKNSVVNGTSFNNTHIVDLSYDSSKSTLWLAAYNAGVIRYNTISNQVHELFIEENTNDGRIHVSKIYRDELNQMYFGTDYGFYKYVDADNRFQVLLPNYNIKSICKNKELFWLGTLGSGAIQIDSKGVIVKKFDITHGLQANHVVSILTLNDKQTLILTKRGLSLLENNDIYNLPFNELNELTEFNTMVLGQDNRVYVGTSNTLFSFNPLDIEKKRIAPKTLLSTIKMDEEELYQFSKLHIKKSYVVPYEKNKLSFEFSSSNLSNPDVNRYQYKLSTVDDDWVQAGKRTFITYQNLDPGKYTFSIRSSGTNRIWSKTETVQFEILTPYWKTWWFILSIIMIILGLAYFIYSIRMEKQKEVKKIRKKIASDLHDHIGSTLTEITLLSELAQINQSSSTDELKKIEEKSRRSIGEMGDMVWAIDSEKDSLQELVLRMKEFALNLMSYNEISVFFNINIIDNTKKISPEKRQHLYFMFKEMIHNIVKHSQASEVNIDIEFINIFKLIIKDNGVGLTDSKSSGNGLKNLKSRAETLNGNISFENQNGLSITLIVKDLG